MTYKKDVAVGIAVSVLAHVGFAVGGEWFSNDVKHVVHQEKEEQTVMLQMPPAEPEEAPEEVVDTQHAAEPQAFSPPSLIDVPQAVSFADFTQQVAPPPIDVKVTNMMTIPSGPPAAQASVVKKLADLFRIEDLDTVPRLVQKGRLAYPPDLKRARVMGLVTLRVIIDQNGSVSVDGVVDSTHQDFVAAAQDFARQCRFQTPTRNGQPVRASYAWPIQFIP